ncbi:kunitz-like toxin PcKuz2 [Drosophila montana]|uniref:kunitz-like toxin PcKuz2 n=1 Tax=Drosophila montana TaxID=40370 RepID=UPI00313DA148
MLRICFFVLMMLLLSDALGWTMDEIVNHIAFCSQLPAYGRCSNHMRMWYYSRQHRSCRPFDYSTCGGNTNRFFTKAECEQHC